jgi:hypothetical protein
MPKARSNPPPPTGSIVTLTPTSSPRQSGGRVGKAEDEDEDEDEDEKE